MSKERFGTQSEINDGPLRGKRLSLLSDFERQSKWDNKQIFDSVLERCYNFLVSWPFRVSKLGFSQFAHSYKVTVCQGR